MIAFHSFLSENYFESRCSTVLQFFLHCECRKIDWFREDKHWANKTLEELKKESWWKASHITFTFGLLTAWLMTCCNVSVKVLAPDILQISKSNASISFFIFAFEHKPLERTHFIQTTTLHLLPFYKLRIWKIILP